MVQRPQEVGQAEHRPALYHPALPRRQSRMPPVPQAGKPSHPTVCLTDPPSPLLQSGQL